MKSHRTRDMAADILTPAILQYIDHSTYPELEDVAASDLPSTSHQYLSHKLQAQQESVRQEISALSRNASSDIDSWISRAKVLQADILRSRETARQIVAEAEAGQELRAKAEDRRKKVALLEKEVEFQKAVQAKLEHVRLARGLLENVRGLIVVGEMASGLKSWEQAEESIRGLSVEGEAESGAAAVLVKRLGKLREQLKEGFSEAWKARFLVDTEERTVYLNSDVEEVVQTAKSLGIFDALLTRYGKEFDRAIIRPRMMVDRQGHVPAIQVSGDRISCKGSNDDSSTALLFSDLTQVMDYLHQQLPASVAGSLFDLLMPSIASRLVEEWLEPAVPVEVIHMPAFQEILKDIVHFADRIDQLDWKGSSSLREWVTSAPRTWLTKRRESLLGDVRNLIFTGLHDKSTVERVETQMVSRDDALAQGGERGEDDWDTAWDVPEEVSPTMPTAAQNDTAEVDDQDEDDSSAWDIPDDGTALDDAEEAWGWGDNNNSATKAARPAASTQQPTPPKLGSTAQQQPQELEMTLRETFTVTAVPDGILDLLHKVVSDAEDLAGPEYSSSPIAPAATALYTLPTLALAMYRATASTSYAKLDTGNMLIYNDVNRLSDQLRSWKTAQPTSTRLRLDNDVKALDRFAKQAYSAEMESQRTILRDLLDSAQGFSNCNAQPFKTECESAAQQTTDRLRDVYTQWRPILSQSVLLQSIGSLLATVTGQMIREIEDLSDIGEAESKELRSLCDTISTAKELFQQQTPNGAEMRDVTFIYCPNWLKFQYLAELMESSLADIKYLWQEGELSLEFSSDEVEGLIEALFAESPLRRQAITEVKRYRRER